MASGRIVFPRDPDAHAVAFFRSNGDYDEVIFIAAGRSSCVTMISERPRPEALAPALVPLQGRADEAAMTSGERNRLDGAPLPGGIGCPGDATSRRE